MNVLISGGQGYVGSALAHVLAQAGASLRLLDREPAPDWLRTLLPSNTVYIRGDVADPTSWQAAVQGIDYIFHLAAVEVPEAADTILPEIQVNALSVLHLFNACQAQQIKPRVIFASSANVFGAVEKLPVTETTPATPLRLWSVHKLLAEHYLRIYSQRFGIPATSLRFANLYGPTVNSSLADRVVINKVARSALQTHGLRLFGNKDCLRDCLFLGDAVAALLAASKIKNPASMYVVGSGEHISIADTWQLLAQAIQKKTGQEVTILEDAEKKLDPSEYRQFVADTTRFQADSSWQATIMMAEGIARTVDWLTQATVR